MFGITVSSGLTWAETPMFLPKTTTGGRPDCAYVILLFLKGRLAMSSYKFGETDSLAFAI